MAKENYMSLRGQLRSDVKFLMDEKTGVEKTAVFTLHTIRRDTYDRAGNLNPKWDKPLIVTSDQEMIRQAKKLKKHDIVEVKGTFETKFVTKHKQCPHCGEINFIKTNSQTIYPSFIGTIVHLESDTEGLKYLIETAEISNIAKVMGRVCSKDEEIITAQTDQGEFYTRYQLAVNRKLFHKDSEDYEDHTDYPFVFSYGNVALDDQAVLKQGALIYVDGYVHTMIKDTITPCEYCGNEFAYKEQRMNLTPYANEYLRDFKMDVLEQTHPVTTNNDVSTNEPEEAHDGDIGE